MSELKYWNEYYSVNPKLQSPSQFAAFVISEFATIDRFIEFGCGNGRDSVFFATYGKIVHATDGSKAVIDSNRQKISSGQLNIEFSEFSIDSNSQKLAKKIFHPSQTEVLYYGRFFIHALTDDEINIFVNVLDEIVKKDDVLCLEYRTAEDSNLAKTTPTHFRNFLDPKIIEEKFSKIGLKLTYEKIGTGLAKFKHDDAHVARQFFKKK